MKGKQERLLEGIRVLDLADEQGSFCSKLLADLGATVIKVEEPEGDPCRANTSFLYHNSNKLGVALSLHDCRGKAAFSRLIDEADVLMETFHPDYLKSLDLDYRRLSRINPRLIHLSITGFGQSGPKRGYHVCDSVLAAFGGQMYMTGLSSGKPLKIFGPQSYYAAALFGANAVLLNLKRRRLTGRGCHIDLSVQEAVASSLDQIWIDSSQNGITAGRRQHVPPREPFAILRCKDGYIQIPILRNWDTIFELMASEGRGGSLSRKNRQNGLYGKKQNHRLVQAIEEWTQTHTKRRLFELGQAMSFPWAPVHSPEEVLKSPQLKARRFFVRAAPAAVKFKFPIPGLPYKFGRTAPSTQMPAPSLGEHTGRILRNPAPDTGKHRMNRQDDPRLDHSAKSAEILRGIRVLDLSRMLSGPYATRILGDFGAEVIKVQSRLTATGAEWNGTAGFRAYNRNKRSICLNLNQPKAREILKELVSVSDVVVENYSPRVMANWELGYKHLRAVKPDIVMASISAMGQTGPWKDFVGFAPTFHAFSGLLSTTCRALDRPVDIGYAYGDIVVGLYAALAILASIEYRDRTGAGRYIDLSAYEALCTLLGPAFVDASLSSHTHNRCRSFDDCSGAMPCGCYPCKGDNRWCVIAVFNEAEWETFCRISARTEWSSRKFSTMARRRKNRTELDELISRWTADRSAGSIVRLLQKAGIAAGVVQSAEELKKDSQLASRHFFTALHHTVLGKTLVDRSALWPWNEGHEHWKVAPSLGQDNHYVFVEMLGHSDQEFRSFVENGIVD